jgi:hypothetical protein
LRYPEAIADFVRAIEIDDPVKARWGLCMLHEATKEFPDHMITDCQWLVECFFPNDANAYLMRGLVHTNHERADLAAGDYGAYVRLRPDDPTGRRDWIEALLAANRPADCGRERLQQTA